MRGDLENECSWNVKLDGISKPASKLLRARSVTRFCEYSKVSATNLSESARIPCDI